MTTTATERPTLPNVGDAVTLVPADHPPYYRSRAGVFAPHSFWNTDWPRPTTPGTVINVERDFLDGEPSENVRVQWDPDGVRRTTWVHVSEIAQPAPVDPWAAIDAALDTLLSTTTLVRGTGGQRICSPASPLQESKAVAMRDALHDIVTSYRSGATLSSTAEAGRLFWQAARRATQRNGTEQFRLDYTTDERSCEQIGAWLAETIRPLADQVQTLNPPVPAPDWSDLALPHPAAHPEYGLVMVHDIDGGTATIHRDPGNGPVYLVDLARLSPLTNRTPLRVTTDQPDYLDVRTGDIVYFTNVYSSTLNARQRINVSRDPGVRPGESFGYVSLRSVVVATDVPVVPAPEPAPPVEAYRDVDGVRYVRLDVVERDLEHLRTTLHTGAKANGLCPVYDKTVRDVDSGTQVLKMGSRYTTFDVALEQTITVRRTIRVEGARDEDDARARAVDQAAAQPVTVAEGAVGRHRVMNRDTARVTATVPVE